MSEAFGPSKVCNSLDHLQALEKRISLLETRTAAYETAFLLDDLNRPGFDDHRKDHRQMREAAKTMEGYKQDGVKTMLKLVITAMVGLLILGLGLWLKGQV